MPDEFKALAVIPNYECSETKLVRLLESYGFSRWTMAEIGGFPMGARGLAPPNTIGVRVPTGTEEMWVGYLAGERAILSVIVLG